MPKNKKIKITRKFLERLVIFFGALCVFSFATGIILGYYPGFNWFYESLSRMGIFCRFFNWALIVSGLCLAGFMGTSFRLFLGNKHLLLESFLLISSGLLSAIGFFPLGSPYHLHMFFAQAFMVSFPLVLFAMSYELKKKNPLAARFTLTCAEVFCLVWLSYICAKFFMPLGWAIPELLSLVVAGFWIFVFIFKFVAPFYNNLNRK